MTLREKIYKALDENGAATDYEHFASSEDVVIIDDIAHDSLACYIIKIHDECYLVGNEDMLTLRFDNEKEAIKKAVSIFKDFEYI